MQEVSPGLLDRKRPQNIFEQIWLTQLWYNQDLRLLLKEVREPIVRMNLLPLPTVMELFSGLDSIIELSDMMLPELEQLARRYNPATSCLSTVMNKYVLKYQVYLTYWGFIYIHWHPEVQSLQQVKRKLNNGIKKLEAARGRVGNQEQSLGVFSIEDYLVRPKSRVIFIKLLLEQYLRKLPASHPDRIAMEVTVMQFNQLCLLYNQRTQLQLEKCRLNHLMRFYEPYFKKSENRRLVSEWPAITAEKLPLWIYLFSDLLLLTRRHLQRQTQELMCILDLNEKSQVIQMIDGAYIQNTIIVTGVQGCIEIRLKDSQRVQQVTNMIYNIIYELGRVSQLNRLMDNNINGLSAKQMHQNNDVRLLVVGCQTMRYHKSPQNLFYVKVLWRNFTQIIVITYDKIKKIIKFTKKNFLKTMLPILSVRDRTRKQTLTETVQFQWLLTMLLLNTLSKFGSIIPLVVQMYPQLNEMLVLSHADTSEHDCNVCRRSLLLPRDLDSYMQYRCYYIVNNKLLSEKDYCFRSHSDLREGIFVNQHSFANSHFKILLYLHYLQGRMDEAFKRLPKDNDSFDVIVTLCRNTGKCFRLTITTTTSVGAILQGILASIESYVHYDYGLFVRYGEQLRLLEQNQIIYDVLADFDPRKRESLFRRNQMDFVDGLNFQIRKYFFIDKQIERVTLMENQGRLQWLVLQAFSDISQQRIVLTHQAMIMATAYYIVLMKMEVSRIHNFPFNQLKLLPRRYLQTTNYLWIVQVLEKLPRITRLDRRVIMESMLQMVQDIHTFSSHLCVVFDNKEPRRLAISRTSISIMQPESQQILMRFRLQDVSVEFKPTSLEIRSIDTHRYHCFHIYSLKSIYDRYMMYSRMENRKLINRQMII